MSHGSTIEFYGGTEDSLVDMEPEVAEHWALTVNDDYQYIETCTYQGTNISKYRLFKTKVYCPKQFLATDNSYKNMFTHELGHALGWFGHSYNSSNVMYATPSSSRTILTSEDKNHLISVY